MKAKLLFRLKLNYPDGGIAELVAWDIPVDFKYPDGIRYRFAFIPEGHSRPAVLYDNHHPKGHHKHHDGRESESSFLDLWSLTKEFKADIGRWLKRAR